MSRTRIAVLNQPRRTPLPPLFSASRAAPCGQPDNCPPSAPPPARTAPPAPHSPRRVESCGLRLPIPNPQSPIPNPRPPARASLSITQSLNLSITQSLNSVRQLVRASRLAGLQVRPSIARLVASPDLEAEFRRRVFAAWSLACPQRITPRQSQFIVSTCAGMDVPEVEWPAAPEGYGPNVIL